MWTFLALALAADHVPVQGIYADATGAPLNGVHSVTFRLHDAESGGTTLHLESQNVAFAGGAFAAMLGVAATLDRSDLARAGDLFVSVEVGGVTSARAEVGWAPRAVYAAEAARALSADDAQLLDGHDSTWFLPAADAWTPGAGFVLTGKSFAVDGSVFAAAVHNHDLATLTGTLPVGKGGTGLSAGPTAAGQVLRASGAGTWAASAIQAGDLPSTLSPSGLTIGSTLVTNAGKVGVGTATPSETLTVNGSFSAAGFRRELVARTVGAAVGDWAELGSIGNTGNGLITRVAIWGHNDSTLFINEYDVYVLQPYAGTTTDWVQVAPRDGRAWNGFEENVALDVRIVAQNAPMELRLRRLTGATGAVGVTAVIEGNGQFTSSTGTGTSATGGTLATGLLGRAGFRVPVATNRFAATTEGLYLTPGGNLGVGTANPAQKLTVRGRISSSVLGLYCGATAAAYTGAGVGGYTGAKAKCEVACGNTNAHMCTTHEVVMSRQHGITAEGGGLWISGYYWSASPSGDDDCDDWAATGESAGVWGWAGGTSQDLNPAPCANSYKIACCM